MNFAVFIISYKRPDKIYTIKTLRKQGYTGKFFIVIDKSDPLKKTYLERYKNKVLIFDKEDYDWVDLGDNITDNKQTPVFVRNALYDLAKKKGIEYFIVMDDDYKIIEWMHNSKNVYNRTNNFVRNLDNLFKIVFKFYSNNNIATIAFAQGGDFIGGKDTLFEFLFGNSIKHKRKAMNIFFCSTKRRIKWLGRLNDDVNTYTYWGNRGLIFLTIYNVSMTQSATQQISGGLTEAYKKFGTYHKSFTTIMFRPSCAKINMIRQKYKRIHHNIKWKFTTPCIVPEDCKKNNL